MSDERIVVECMLGETRNATECFFFFFLPLLGAESGQTVRFYLKEKEKKEFGPKVM